MKTRQSKAHCKASRTEKKLHEHEQLKEIKAALRRPLITAGPFDWAERARQAEEAGWMNNVAASLRSKHAEANELHQETVRRRREALKVAYPPGFWDDFQSLRAGESNALEIAVRFLEADPWFFGTGYVKADFIKWITRLDLSERDGTRLQRVVIHAVDSRDRREFRSYCRLARRVDDPALRQALTERLESEDEGVRRRARWALESLGAIPKGDQDRQYLLQKFLKSSHSGLRTLARMQLGLPTESEESGGAEAEGDKS